MSSSRTLVESRAGRFMSPGKGTTTSSNAVSGLKVTGVRIDTDNVAMWRKSLKPTGATVVPDGRLPRPSALNSIADTRINPAKPVIHAPTPMQSRRKQRYTRAEEALSKSLKHCKPEPTPQELQIRVLEQVTALLGAHAKEAQERATKLRGVLADNKKETDPQTYAAMQRERWMEEKRRGVVDSEAKAVREQILSLSRFGAKGKTRAEASSKALDEEALRRASNLAKFFELSPTRKPISSRKKSSPSSYNRAPRRVTMNDAPPMLLRTSIVPSFAPYTESHARSISLDGKFGNRSSTASSRYPNNSPLAAVAEDITADTSTVSPSDARTPTSQPSISHRKPTDTGASKPKLPPQTLGTPSGSGFATIYAPATLRSKADILASMEDIEAELPSYALVLMGDLDYIRDQIPLRSPTSDQNGARTTTPPASAAPVSNERTTPSRHKSPKSISLQGLSSTRSLLRKSHSTSPTKKSRPPSHPHSPLSNLFSISESSSTTPIPIPITNPTPSSSALDSVASLSLPFTEHIPSTGLNANINLPRTSSSTASSFEIVHTIPHVPHADAQSSSSKLLRQRFPFLGRK